MTHEIPTPSASATPEVLREVLAAYALPDRGAEAERARGGLIHDTFLVRLADGRTVVPQRVNALFAPERFLGAMVADAEAVTAHLAASGLDTPRLLRTRDGALAFRDAEGGHWRAFSYVEGATIERVHAPRIAGAAGALVARFHGALASLSHAFQWTLVGLHDTAAYRARLEALVAGDRADETAEARALGEQILADVRALPALGALPARVGHGDLKISNVRFADAEGAHARALLDLDSVGHYTLAYELGDAMRSWCNAAGEDSAESRFEPDVFEAAVRGYAASARAWVSREEAGSLVLGTATVSLELAMRFCLDAFEDKHFGWDPSRFPSRRAHNLLRARGQRHLGRAVLARRREAEAVVASAFAGG